VTSLLVLASLAAVTPPTLVAAPASPNDGCPNAHQVTEALQSRLPNSVVPANELLWPAQREIARAVLEVAPDGSLVRFSLVNARGETQLRRTLSVTSQGRFNECQALAETLAAIVERFLDFTTYESSDAADVGAAGSAASGTRWDPARRHLSLFLGAAWRINDIHSSGDLEGRLGGQFDVLTRPFRAAITVSGGVASAQHGSTRDVDATLRRYPLRLGLVADLPRGPGSIQPIVELGVDLTRVDASSRTYYREIPNLNGAIAYRVNAGKRLYFRAVVGGGLTLVRYDVLVGDDAHVVFRTPAAYARVGVETGFVFR
jgi:hypothetical protein